MFSKKYEHKTTAPRVSGGCCYIMEALNRRRRNNRSHCNVPRYRCNRCPKSKCHDRYNIRHDISFPRNNSHPSSNFPFARLYTSLNRKCFHYMKHRNKLFRIYIRFRMKMRCICRHIRHKYYYKSDICCLCMDQYHTVFYKLRCNIFHRLLCNLHLWNRLMWQ